MTEDAEHSETRELIPEIAAGVAAGDERALALAHLGDCQLCRYELAETADLVDELLTLAPEREPSAGFESAVMARIAPEAEPQQQPRRRRVGQGRRLPALRRPALGGRALRLATWTAATAVVAGLVAGTVWWRTGDDRELAADYRHTLAVAHGHGLSAAPLMSVAGSEAGTMFAYQGMPSWLYVTFRPAPPPIGHYEVTLVTKNGRRLPLRPLEVRPNVYTAWGSTIRVQVKEIDAIEFAKSGASVLQARF
jgi:hypothetical protein